MTLWHGDVFRMMTSSNGNIFRVTGPLCGEFTGPGEFPTQRPVTRSFDVFFDLRLNKRLSKQPWGWWFETLSWSLWRHRNGLVGFMRVESTGSRWSPLTKGQWLELWCFLCCQHDQTVVQTVELLGSLVLYVWFKMLCAPLPYSFWDAQGPTNFGIFVRWTNGPCVGQMGRRTNELYSILTLMCRTNEPSDNWYVHAGPMGRRINWTHKTLATMGLMGRKTSEP